MMPVATFDGHSNDLPNAKKNMLSVHPTGVLSSNILDSPVLVGGILIDNWLVVWNMFHFSIYWE